MLTRLLGLDAVQPITDADDRVTVILRSLPAGWFTFNDLPTIDHLVIGPAGVFTLDAKSGAESAWPAGRALMAGGAMTDYLPKAVLASRRASRLLAKASSRSVGVRPVLIVAGLAMEAAMSERGRPSDVTILRPGDVLPWFRRQPAVLSDETVSALVRAARDPATWQ